MVQYLHFRILKFYSTSVWCGLYVDVDRTPKKREKNWTPGRYAENILVSWFSSIFWDQNTRTRRFSLPWVGRRRSLKPWRSAWNLSWRVANDRRWALTALDGCGKPAWWFQWRKWWRLSISGVMDQGLKVTEPATSEGWLEKTYDWFRRVPWRNAALINDLNRSWFHSNSYRLRASQGIPGHPRASQGIRVPGLEWHLHIRPTFSGPWTHSRSGGWNSGGRCWRETPRKLKQKGNHATFLLKKTWDNHGIIIVTVVETWINEKQPVFFLPVVFVFPSLRTFMVNFRGMKHDETSDLCRHW